MAPQVGNLALAAAGAVLVCFAGRSASFVPSGASPGLRSARHLETFNGVSASPEPVRVFSDQDVNLSSSSALWLSVVGVALAGVSLGAQRRDVGVQMGTSLRKRRGRFEWRFGGEGAPKPPKWLQQERTPGEKTSGGHEVPAWLTFQKWQSWSAPVKCRSVRWWRQVFDERGEWRIPKGQQFSVPQAVDAILEMNKRAPLKFDPTMECMMKMNLDAKFPDQQIRCNIELPHGTGKRIRVAVYCSPDEEEEVLAFGADLAGKTLQDQIAAEKIEFDVLLARPQSMPALAKLGKILGPRRLMPSPKSGTVVSDIRTAVETFKSGKTVELRNSRHGLVALPVGKLSYGKEKLVENFRAALQGLADKKPAGAKQNFWKAVYLGSTMSPSCRIQGSEFPKIKVKNEDDD
ncbi:unnamed protein product [Polarella glacialis]|uniref:Ribosomal protein n=1 Tax=Polarella glacialis TaxID=89957 RepID=A0A813FUZ4_POLGL|nr:unnamed protein product [Polarella glacialis]